MTHNIHMVHRFCHTGQGLVLLPVLMLLLALGAVRLHMQDIAWALWTACACAVVGGMVIGYLIGLRHTRMALAASPESV